jgi:hypothetical protein
VRAEEGKDTSGTSGPSPSIDGASSSGTAEARFSPLLRLLLLWAVTCELNRTGAPRETT